MLVLSREKDESITIGEGDDAITVMIIQAGYVVRLGIDAPDDLRIMRTELLDKGAEG
jgi:carbon storage regulator CsrA